MAEIKWIKITTDIFDDEKIKIIDTMPARDEILVIWFKLLSLAGKVNQSGLLFMNNKIAYTPEMLAAIFNRELNTIRLSLSTFEKFGMISIEDNEVIAISNWEKHQNIDGMDKIREQNRIRQHNHRNKQKQLTNSNVTDNVTLTLSNGTDKDKEEEKDKDKEHQDNVFVVFQKEIGQATPMMYEGIKGWLEEFTEDIIILAIQKASLGGIRTYKYIDGILKNWLTLNVKVVADINRLDEEFEAKKSKTKSSNKKDKFNNYEQRTDIDYDALANQATMERVGK